MTGHRRLSKSLTTLDLKKQDIAREFPGILGATFKGQTLVEVPNRAGFVYVRLRSNTSEIIQAFNETVSPVTDLPVIVIRDLRNNRYYIKGRDIGKYQEWGGGSSYLPRHGAQHSFPDDSWGGDIVWVYDRQFIPLSISPSGTLGSNNVYVNGDMLWWQGTWMYAGETGTPNILAYKPTGAYFRMVLVYIDSHGNPALLAGSQFPENITGMSQVIPYLPTLSATEGIPLGAVRIGSGTTSINWNLIYDLRQLISYALVSGSSGGGGGHVIQEEGTPLTQRTNLNFKGYPIWATDDAGNNASIISNSGTMVAISATAPSGTFPGLIWVQPT